MEKQFNYDIDEEIGKCMAKEEEAFPGVHRPAYENLIIAMYELGAVCRHTIYSGRKLESIETAARAADICGELGDLITQSLIAFRKFAKHTKGYANMSASDIIYDGLERQQHRMGELIAKGGVDILQDKGLFAEA